MSVDWAKYKHFKKAEFDCSFTGKNRMRPEFIDILHQIRMVYNRPMVISSGFRDTTHPLEVLKARPGTHTYGVAADIICQGEDAQDLMVIAYGFGIRRFGLDQKGPGRFIHIDIGDKGLGFPVALWTY